MKMWRMDYVQPLRDIENHRSIEEEQGCKLTNSKDIEKSPP